MGVMTSIVRGFAWIGITLVILAGCETLNPITMGAGIVSYATTGKGLADHALGRLTRKDCNILGGLLSAERKICEPLGSAAAQQGFKGFFAASSPGANGVGTKLRLSESIAEVRPVSEVSRSVHFPLDTPILRLSDTIESSSGVSAHTPDRLAQSSPASAETKL